MFAFIRNLFSNKKIAPNDSGPTELPMFDPNARMDKMTFAERKVWRQEMVHRSLRESFGDVGIISAMYRHKVSRLDDRGHFYALMIDVTKDFAVSQNIKINGFVGLEQKIVKDAFERYGVVIKGVYWKTNDDVNIFERESVGVRHMPDEDVLKKSLARARLEAEFSDTMPMEYMPDTRAITRPKFEPVDPLEAEAFRNALRQGTHPPPIHVGNKEYFSDLAPLSIDTGN